MRTRFDTVVTATLLLCALTITGLVLRREFIKPTATPSQMDRAPVFVEEWREHLDKGVRMGPAGAQVQVLEFADFECPYCGTFHQDLKALRSRYPAAVAVTFVHFPLPMHRFAEPAARAAECAGEQGRFEAMHDVLFESQRELGLTPWAALAREAGVADAVAFDACMASMLPIPRIAEGQKLGATLDVKGTPTLVVNGWKLGRPPNLTELDRMAKAVLAGSDPIPRD